jgi:acyl-CoA thioester hydrolase
VPRRPGELPPNVASSTVHHRVPFYETDAMGVVHHSNYVRYLELARIRWMDEHHRSYREYVAESQHFATTHVEVDYYRPAVFDDEIRITAWLEWIRGASLRMAYRLTTAEGLMGSAATEHALVDLSGRVQRIPRQERERLARLAEQKR